MKKISIILLAGVFASMLFPFQSFALSCMPENMMIDSYVNDENYVIVKAVAGERVEHVSKPAEEEYMFDEGYTGQRIAVSQSLKGYIEDDVWVYWNVNSTWQYMCAGAPPTEGTENLYILRKTNDPFSLTTVNAAYPVDSQLVADIETALTEAEIEGQVNEASPTQWSERLTAELKRMVFILRIKLAEWRFWNAQ